MVQPRGVELQLLAALARLEQNVAKLDEQMQCIRTSLTTLDGSMQLLLEAQNEGSGEDEEEEEEEESDDDDASDMSFVVEDHSSSSGSYDTDDTY